MDDGSDPSFNFDGSNGGSNRFATIFMYLIAPEIGGQTVFPLAEDTHPDMIGGEVPSLADDVTTPGSWQRALVNQCYSKFAVKPVNVSSILFYSQLGDGSGDYLSEHGACPPLKGEKWGANLWVWNRRRHGLDFTADTSTSTTSSSSHLEITFENAENVPIELLWEDTPLSSLGVGESLRFNTYLGHQWSAREQGHEERRWFYTVVADDQDSLVSVTFHGGKDEL
jgi:prolyl 4-hydroxylase